MGEAFITRRGGSGGGGAGATLVVTGVITTPASTVTINNTAIGKTYTKTLDSTGKATFKGLRGGTWNISMTDGTTTVTSAVEIVMDYAKSLTYTLILFADGAASAESGGFTNSSIANRKLQVGVGARGWAKCNSNNAIDVTAFKTLTVKISSTYGTYSGYTDKYFGLTPTKNSDTFLAIVHAPNRDETTYTLDISNVTGNVYFQLNVQGAYDAGNTAYISSIIMT